jgi:hypothetical protein
MNRHSRLLDLLFVITIGIALSSAKAAAASAAGTAKPEYRPLDIHNTASIDANNIEMMVTNHASFAYDLTTMSAGLWYPIDSGMTCVYASGLWIGAKVGGDIRVTVGDYAQEFAPGIILPSGLPDNPMLPEHRVYKIVKGDTLSLDYIEWPGQYGAPVDEYGRPLLLGDQTLWCVYNDADPIYHILDPGGTEPLGVEVQQTVFAFDSPGAMANTVFLKFKILNKGSNMLDSTFISIWSDPDVGGVKDDYVGCDSTLCLGFAYNGADSDAVYGTTPPCVGYDLLKGPISDEGSEMGMTSFNRLTAGTDPRSHLESYNYMRGLYYDGSLVIDPTTGEPNAYMVAGDPVRGTGWLDDTLTDKRFMMNTGPFTMEPGDSQEMVIAIIIGDGDDRVDSVWRMKLQDFDVQWFHNLDFASGVGRTDPPVWLLTAYPNPSRSAVSIRYDLRGNEPTQLTVYNTLGQTVKTLVCGTGADSAGRALWDLRDNAGERVSPGIYFCRVPARLDRQALKIVVLR